MSKKREELLRELEREVRQSNVLGAFFFRAIGDRVGMNAIDLQVTNILDMTGPTTAGRIAELTGLTTGAITGMLNRLEKAGAVRREKDPDDRRKVIVRLAYNEDMPREIGPVFASIGKAWDDLASRYNDEQLTFLLEFLKLSNSLSREEITKLREAPKGGDGDFSAPLEDLKNGRLVFVSGASRLALRAEGGMADLYRARFEGPSPDVKTEGSIVTVRYQRRFRPLEWRGRSAEVTLNAAVPWDIEVRGGGSEISADLEGLSLTSLELKGGASKVEISLPRPEGVVPVRFSGGASNVSIRRPPGVAARLQLKGGAARVAFDEQGFGAIGGSAKLQSTDYAPSNSNRYEIEILGGASAVTIDTP